MEKVLSSRTELEAEAAEFARGLRPRAEGATLVTLSGELGAGKTAFTKAVAAALGVEESVTSPTFVLEKMYLLPPSAAFKKLLHIDAYRLEKGSDLAPLGFTELLQYPENVIMLEWPEKVKEALPQASVAITLVARDDGSRLITYG